VYNTIFAENLGKPSVALVHKDFMADGRSAASGRLMPGVRLVAESVPCECSVLEDINCGVTAAVNDIITGLTEPLTENEQFPKKEIEKPPDIVFKGTSEEVSRFFYQRGWTDGLPIVPPTEEKVAEMPAGTDLPREHVVAKIIPRSGKATVEKIAINAVMAGALPTYMPLLIAGVQAIMEPRGCFGTYEVSTGSWAPCLLVNGPVRRQLNINCGSGVMSPGDIANAAIGRALGLIIKNMGGARKGVEDMGVMGNPMKYSLVLGENEEDSPWNPLHVQQSLLREDSAVTVFFPNTLLQLMSYGSNDEAVLRSIAYNIPPGRRGLICLLLNPAHANTLAGSGWTRQDVTSFISEYARAPLSHHQEYWGSFRRPKDKRMLNSTMDSPYESVSILRSPEWLRVFVTGGPGNILGMLMGGVTVGATGWVTKKIELPLNWETLVARYKGIVPKYVRY
jgi:hypothetical protein